MDNFDYEVIESNLLKPSVKTIHRNSDIALSLKSARFAGTRLQSCQQPFHTKPEDSSMPMILKNTSERKDKQILKQHSLVSYTNSHTNQDQLPHQYNNPDVDKRKPLIQVTVTPKSERYSCVKLLRKHKIVTNTIQNTPSNHESSIRNKNVYLVVAGRKKEKIYEVKTTSSAKFTKEYIDHDDVEDLYNFKQFIKNWNMERKKKTNKKKVEVCKEKETYVDVCEQMSERDGKVKASKDIIPDVGSSKGRVRIYGRIGLNEDDKYVVNCQATVDDKLVSSAFSATEDNISSFSASPNDDSVYPKISGIACVREDNIAGLRDCITQTDNRNNEENGMRKKFSRNINRRDTISTQVDFNDKSNRNNLSFFTNVGCDCSDCPVIKTEYNGNNMRGCQSPLVVISVFPKQDNTVETVNAVQWAQLETQSGFSNDHNKPTSNFNNKTKSQLKSKTIRSRSPSPKSLNKITPGTSRLVKSNIRKQNFNSNINKDVEIKKRQPRSPRAKFPTNSPARSRTKSPTYASQSPDLKSPAVSPKSPRNKSPITVLRKPEKKSLATLKSPGVKSESQRLKSPISHKTEIQRNVTVQKLKFKTKPREGQQDKGINTEHLKAKKTLVDSYTKKLSEQMNARDNSTKKSTSEVSVNIDSKNEFYDVVIRQDRFTTDLNVRKTIKDVSDFDDKRNHGLTEKLPSRGNKKHQQKAVSQAISDIRKKDANVTISPRLTLRDSLEISHRREGKTIKDTQTHRDSDQHNKNTEDMKYFAPIKHYTGDDCRICDPVKRDREIRELLGVKGRRRNDQVSEAGDGSHPCYPSQCDGDLIYSLKGNTLVPCFNETSKLNTTNCDQIAKIDKQDQNERTDCLSAHKSPHLNLNHKDLKSYYTERSNFDKMINSLTQYEATAQRKSYQLNCNRDFQVFLLLDQIKRQKPILLTRKQYVKVKRTIDKISSSKRLCNRSLVSVGRVREKSKRDLVHRKKEHATAYCKVKPYKREPLETVILFSNNARVSDKRKFTKEPERHTASTMEFSCSVSKHVTFSTTNLESAGSSRFAHRNMTSIETIFRGHKKSPTPNLGTSSLYLPDSTISETSSRDTRSRKPFIKRLFSCLVMRSARSSLRQIEATQSMTANSSIDSYHISTSLGAITMTSSIYDTTASFYSDHAVHPLSSKLKRGFLSSIRGFLVSKKT